MTSCAEYYDRRQFRVKIVRSKMVGNACGFDQKTNREHFGLTIKTPKFDQILIRAHIYCTMNKRWVRSDINLDTCQAQKIVKHSRQMDSNSLCLQKKIRALLNLI